MSQKDPYSDLPLSSPDSIRVLDLLPGRRKDDIKLKLRTVNLSKQPNYEALSYTWGASSEGKTIQINDIHRLNVTDNLHAALLRIRRARQARTLWVDAICINQNDLDERSKQVAMMSNIYKTATCVIVWLGETHMEHWGIKAPKMYLPNRFWWRVFRPPQWTSLYDTIVKKHHLFIDIALHYASPRWHQRAWVAQEFAFAKDIVVWFGNRHVKFELERFGNIFPALYLNDAGEFYLALVRLTVLLRSQGSMGAERDGNGNDNAPDISLVRMYDAMDGYAASDPRDMVFSVLGMIRDSEASQIPVDYTLSLAEVYSRATFASLKAEGGCRILTRVIVHRSDKLDLPSWAVDFEAKRVQHYESTKVGCDELNEVLESSYTSSLCLDDSSKYLTISGLVCDRITATMGIKKYSMFDSDGSQAQPALSFMIRAFTTARDSLLQDRHVASNCFEGHALLHRLTGDIVRRDWVPSARPNIYADSERIVEDAVNCWITSISQHSQLVFPQLSLGTEWKVFRNDIGDCCSRGGKNCGARLIRTTCGLAGLASCAVDTGDIIVIVRGPSHFAVLSKVEDGKYRFKGFAWLFGLMHELFWARMDWSQWADVGRQTQQFILC